MIMEDIPQSQGQNYDSNILYSMKSMTKYYDSNPYQNDTTSCIEKVTLNQ